MESILYNLLSNAFKFTLTGGEIRFEVNYLQQGRPVCEIIVADTGTGVNEEEKAKIFDRFYQVAQAEPGKYIGTGIGLAFVKDLVELHKGTIQVCDNKTQGSLFTIRFPAVEANQSSDEYLNSDEPLPDNENIAEDENTEDVEKNEQPILLVVEDNADLNQYLCKILGACGEVVSAKDGKEGLEKALQTIPDLVVSDVMMPEMDGYAFCKTLKEDNRTSHIPVILLTAKSDDQSHIAGIKLGADIYMDKPFTPAILTSHVQNLIKSRKKLKELFAQRLNLEPGEVEVASFNEVFIKNAIRFVEENIEKDEFSIDDLAVQLNMSRSTFYRKLKAVTGMSGSDFIRVIKLKRSAQLLKTGEYTVSMAAYSAGFNDLKHFRKSFQKQFGTTPSEYIKKKDP
jgi:DNA-binding response OmpR family regulator